MASKRGRRRASSGKAKGAGGSMLPWYAAGVVVLAVGYGHWGDLAPRWMTVTHGSPASVQTHAMAAKPALAPVPRAKPEPIRQASAMSPVPPAPIPASAPPPASVSESFGFCGDGPHFNCVVDGSTFWVRGAKIRIADIDTPELSPPRCAEEQRRGLAAKLRLLVLLNDGPFRLEANAGEEDKPGQAIRNVMRGGRSIGEILVGEGLARRGTGHSAPWCA